jgi:hypothetical protein
MQTGDALCYRRRGIVVRDHERLLQAPVRDAKQILRQAVEDIIGDDDQRRAREASPLPVIGKTRTGIEQCHVEAAIGEIELKPFVRAPKGNIRCADIRHDVADRRYEHGIAGLIEKILIEEMMREAAGARARGTRAVN